MRACALVGEFPAVYDFASSQKFKPAYVPDKAIFHLHGQRAGFSLLHTEEEVNALSESLKPVFEDAGKGRTWLVVGYSGDNDPVFEHLARVPEFDYGLYWITFRDEEPASHVKSKLLSKDKGAFYVNGYDADEFFVELSQKLDCFPPDLISRPFTHMDRLLEMLTPVELPKVSEEFDFISKTRELVGSAIKRYEETVPTLNDDTEKQAFLKEVIAAQKAILEGDVTQAMNSISKIPKVQHDPQIKRLHSWSYIMAANKDTEMAKYQLETKEEADRLFAMAGEKYQAALDIKPDMHEALNNWGNALLAQAETKSGEEADRLFAMAGEKYQAALDIKADKHEALYNWGNALLAQAKIKSGEEADRLFAMAGEKYQAALDIKPDMHDALSNWGSALLAQAETKSGEEADRLSELAEKKFRDAEAVLPGIAAYNLACFASRKHDEAMAYEWLKLAKSKNSLPNREHLIKDTDLDNVRNNRWFLDFLG